MKNLRWMGPILDSSGYASAGRGYLYACEKSGTINVQARDRSRSINLKNKGMDQPILDMYGRLYGAIIPENAPCVQHQVPDCFLNDRKTSLRIGYTIFEMSRVPSVWTPFCNNMDVLWTGSEYSKEAFVNSGVKTPIHVLPHALDIEAFENAKPWRIENRRSFAFLSVFDFTSRKGWQDLLRAYWMAFNKDDDVCLILKVFFGDFSDASRVDIARRIVNYRLSLGFEDRAPILLYGHDVPNSEMPGLYKSADCYVGISREGFGLSYAEAMAAGVACIGPKVGGTRQFMTPDNSLLIDYIGDEPIDAEMIRLNPIFDGLSWTKHSWEHLSFLMRQVASDSTMRKTIAEQGMRTIAEELNYQTIGDKIASLLP